MRNRLLSLTMKWSEKAAIFVAWSLPREVVYWAFIRAVVETKSDYPGEQKVSDVQAHWIRNTPL